MYKFVSNRESANAREHKDARRWTLSNPSSIIDYRSSKSTRRFFFKRITLQNHRSSIRSFKQANENPLGDHLSYFSRVFAREMRE